MFESVKLKNYRADFDEPHARGIIVLVGLL